MVPVPTEVLVHVDGFPVNKCFEGVIEYWGKKGVQERYGTIIFWIFHAELDVRINGVDLLEVLVNMFSLLDDRSVIHVHKPESGWIWGKADGFDFKLFHEQVCN